MTLKDLIATDKNLTALAEKLPELVDALQVAIDANDPVVIQTNRDALLSWFDERCRAICQDIRTGGIVSQDQIAAVLVKD